MLSVLCNRKNILLWMLTIIFLLGNAKAQSVALTGLSVPRGQVDTIGFFHIDRNIWLKALVYVPKQIDGPLPILYLLHGMDDNKTSWMEQGGIVQILDNMIADSLIKPVIVVMPDCNHKKSKHRSNSINRMFNYFRLQRKDFENAFPDLYDFVLDYCAKKMIPVSPDYCDHFIAGLSVGAKQAANIVRKNPSVFSKIGLFSPAFMGRRQLPTANVDSSFENCRPLYCVYVGLEDPFLKNGKRFMKKLDKAGVEYCYSERDERHTWQAWRGFLVEFLLTVLDTDTQ